MKGINAVLQGDGSAGRNQWTNILAGHPPLATRQGRKIRSLEDGGQTVHREQPLAPVLNNGQQVEGIAGVSIKAGLPRTGALDTRQQSSAHFTAHSRHMKYINRFVGLDNFGRVVDRQWIGFPGRCKGVQGQPVDS